MGRNLGLDEVVDHFTLVGDELVLLRNTSGATRLGFAALLKFLLWRGRFPRAAHELPQDAVAHLVDTMLVEISKLLARPRRGRVARPSAREISSTSTAPRGPSISVRSARCSRRRTPITTGGG